MELRNRSLLLVMGCFSLALSSSAQSQEWQLDPAHSSAEFSVRHMGISTVRGTFTKLSGSVHYDPADLSKTTIDVSIDAASVDTRVSMRDNDLRGDHFLDVAKYPSITFKSKSAESAGDGKLKVAGDLTLHGVTKPVVLNVDGPSQPMKDPRGKTHVGAAATTTIKRSEFRVNGAAAMVGDEISITIDVELVNGNGEMGTAPNGPPPPHN